MSTPRVRLPKSAGKGEIVEIRTLIDHPMITGVSSPAPRDMLATFVVRMNGEVIFNFDFKNGTSANPYVVFFARIEETSTFDFIWTHENGTEFTSTGDILVS